MDMYLQNTVYIQYKKNRIYLNKNRQFSPCIDYSGGSIKETYMYIRFEFNCESLLVNINKFG